MIIHFVRHSLAEDPRSDRDDSSRALTRQGIARAQRLGICLAQDDIKIDAILSSPYIRAWQTAEILGLALGLVPEECGELESGQALTESLQPIFNHAGFSIALMVGHQPHLSELLRWLCGSAVSFSPATCVAVDLSTWQAGAAKVRTIIEGESL